MKMGARVSLRFDETRDGLVDQMVAEVATVGIGWVHLEGSAARSRAPARAPPPSAGGRARDATGPPHPSMGHSARGVLATISGPASADGRTRLAVGPVEIVDDASPERRDAMKLYSDQLYRGDFTDINYGWDNVEPQCDPCQSLVPDPGISEHAASSPLSTRGTSPAINSGKQTATTEVPVTARARPATRTAAATPGTRSVAAWRRRSWSGSIATSTGTLRKDNQVVQKDVQATGVTYWLRAGRPERDRAGILRIGRNALLLRRRRGNAPE